MADLSLEEATAAVAEATEAVTTAKKVALAVVIRELRSGLQPPELEKPSSPWTASYIRTVAYDNSIELAGAKSKSRFAAPSKPRKPAEPLDAELAALAARLTLAEATAAVIAAEEQENAAKELAVQAVVDELREGGPGRTVPHVARRSPWGARYVQKIARKHGIELQETMVRPKKAPAADDEEQ